MNLQSCSALVLQGFKQFILAVTIDTLTVFCIQLLQGDEENKEMNNAKELVFLLSCALLLNAIQAEVQIIVQFSQSALEQEQ